MIKRMSFMLFMVLFVITTSCKKEEASSNTSATEVPNVVKSPAKLGGVDMNAEPARPAPPADGKYPVLTFDTKEHDFGQITQGDKVTYSFKFKNTGEADLFILSARGTCGCTIPEYPKEAVKPGESAKIKVSFNSAGKRGETGKSVFLTCNTKEGKEELKIKSTINVPEGATKK